MSTSKRVMGVCLCWCAFAPVLVAQQSFSVVRVAVRSTAGLALGGAQVRSDTTVVESDDAGLGILPRVAPGGSWIRVRRIGYRPESLFVQTVAGKSLDTTVILARVAVDLAPITVVGRRELRGPMAGFYNRKATGSGRFITSDDIARRNPTNFTDLLRSVPGFRVETRGFTNTVRVRGSRCAPLVWLDGQGLFAAEIDLDAFDPRTFAGIEIYSGSASVPVEFQGNQRMSSGCGTLVLWSRTGEPRGPKQKKDAQTPASLIAQWIDQGKAFAAADVDRLAILDSAKVVRPIYPDSLFNAQAPGRVLTEFVVGTNGEMIAESFSAITTTHRSLVEPTRAALRDQRFIPAQRKGQPVQQVMQLPFDFIPDSTARRKR
jgi:hypothetical protein